MRQDYRWILEQAFKRVGLNEDAERHLRDILLEAEGQFPEQGLEERTDEAPQDTLYEAQLTRFHTIRCPGAVHEGDPDSALHGRVLISQREHLLIPQEGQVSRDPLHPSSHWLQCGHYIGGNGFDYSMPCDVLKDMPGGRVKIRVYGNRYWGGSSARIRYVSKWRVRVRKGS